jgi:hypothetical protein
MTWSTMKGASRRLSSMVLLPMFRPGQTWNHPSRHRLDRLLSQGACLRPSSHRYRRGGKLLRRCVGFVWRSFTTSTWCCAGWGERIDSQRSIARSGSARSPSGRGPPRPGAGGIAFGGRRAGPSARHLVAAIIPAGEELADALQRASPGQRCALRCNRHACPSRDPLRAEDRHADARIARGPAGCCEPVSTPARERRRDSWG